MLRVSVLLGVAMSAVLGSGPRVCAQSDTSLKRTAEDYWDARMERFPVQATAIGDYRFNDRLEDFSQEGILHWQNKLQDLLKELGKVSKDSLSPDDRLTRDLLERTLHDELLSLECRTEYMPLEPLDGPHIRFPLILVSQPFRNAADFMAYVARLKAFPKQVDDLIANMRDGARRKMVSPSVIIDKIPLQIQPHLVAETTKSEFYAPVRILDTVGESERESITKAIREAIENDVVPAYRKLMLYIIDEYVAECRPTVGFRYLPGGDRLYGRLAYLNATIVIDPDAIHALGLSEVERIRGKMAEIQNEWGFEGSLDEFLEHMRTDPKHRFSSGAELVAAADKILQRTKPRMPKLFGRIPKTDCVMKEIESFRAPASPVAYYNPPAEDGSRPGYYYINTFQPQERLRFTLEALTYHEAVPGHHFQIALHQENTSLPKFRRYASFTAFVEGWALYTEKLGFEIGGYQDLDSQFGQLTFEMWRACRLVVDTGMHHKGWTREEAIGFMAKNTSLARVDIENEVDRYISWPGQALAYKIGELRILQLRKEAEAKWGDKFDIKAFHDRLLAEGAMPINMLETRMRDWITSQK